MRFRKKNILLLLIVVVIASQFIRIEHSNPPVVAELTASRELMSILRRSCFDCHSNETVWPWYTDIAPISWLVAYDVNAGRKQLNFSVWGKYDVKKRAKLKKEIWEQVDEGEMPPLQYYPAHLNARLSESDKNVIHSWSTAD